MEAHSAVPGVGSTAGGPMAGSAAADHGVGLWWEGSCACSHGTNPSAMVAVLFIATANATVLSSAEVARGRLLIVRAKIESSVYCLVNICAPDQGTEKVKVTNYHQDQFIIGGDFNCTLHFTMDRTSEEPHPQSSQSLHSIITHLDLLEVQTSKIQTIYMGDGQQ